MTKTAPVTATQVRETIARYEQFCRLHAEEPEDAIEVAIRHYAIDYLGFTPDALDELQEYVATDEELLTQAACHGPVVLAMFISGVMMGAAIKTEAGGEVETDVEVPDPGDFE